MQRFFAVTALAERIDLDGDRRGEACFTVSSRCGADLRVRFQAVAVDGANANWFRVLGESERLVCCGGTDQVRIAVTVPGEAPPGTGRLRLDLIGIANPDEYHCIGQEVRFDIVGAGIRRAGAFPAWILFVLAGVLATAGVVARLTAHSNTALIVLMALAVAAAAAGVVLIVRRTAAGRGTP